MKHAIKSTLGIIQYSRLKYFGFSQNIHAFIDIRIAFRDSGLNHFFIKTAVLLFFRLKITIVININNKHVFITVHCTVNAK